MDRESFLGKWPAVVENVLQRKSPRGVIIIDKQDGVRRAAVATTG